ncbi:MAG: oligosaccharide repeat unit polymerase [Methanobrevibacter sp.]|uniref:oligosaccharide repeat unit polymerase family protein n=1 Tax=Methanobrevibacter sp. TaxID=66852 RepID=UPI0025FAE079|nr:oligosaccharide repeat unit polymerase family protein [Methanobrevibacter sp.]MBE6508657.1 oligosaccharide repeat unit polymerase [Methanobrevibacter sp.]
MDYKKFDIFSPMVFVLLIIIYLMFSEIAFYSHLNKLIGVNLYTIGLIFLGIVFYIIGIALSNYFLKNKEINLNSEKIDKIFSERLVLSMVILGILLQIANLIYLGGIPLFSGYLKARAATRIWLLSYLIFLPSINILIAKYDNKKYYLLFILGLLLFVSTGYRTTAMAIVISVLITLYYTKDLPWKYLILSIIAIFILLVVVGYVAVKSIEWQTWTTTPIELLFYRAGYTLQVLDHAAFLQGSTHGQLLYNTLMGFFKSSDPRVIVGSTTLGHAHSTTSTIFGPALLDFGTYAMLLQMIILGFIMNLIYKVQINVKSIFIALYAILMAHLIIWIETGPTDLVVILFYLISIIILIYSVNLEKVSNK